MPRPLMFSRRYLSELLRGNKTCTIRLGNMRYRIGDTALVYCGGLVLGRVRITSIERKKLVDLTERDARLDGFSNLYELLKALRQHYPHIRADTPMAVIRFEWVEKFEVPLSDSEYSWGYEERPIEVARLALEELDDLSWEERTVLETFVESGSVRAAARRLGGLSLRPVVRGVLRRAAEKLAERGLIKRR